LAALIRSSTRVATTRRRTCIHYLTHLENRMNSVLWGLQSNDPSLNYQGSCRDRKKPNVAPLGATPSSLRCNSYRYQIVKEQVLPGFEIVRDGPASLTNHLRFSELLMICAGREATRAGTGKSPIVQATHGSTMQLGSLSARKISESHLSSIEAAGPVDPGARMG